MTYLKDKFLEFIVWLMEAIISVQDYLRRHGK